MSYLALFLTSDLVVIGTKKFNPTDIYITFKNGTFNIRLEAFMYKTKDSTIYGYIYPTDEKVLIDIVTKDYILQEPIKKGDKTLKLQEARLVFLKEKIEHGDLHLLVAESIVGQLARAFLQTVKNNWLFIILALGSGIAIGYIAGSALAPHSVTTIYNSTMGNNTRLGV